MKDQFKTKQVLIQELASLKRRVKKLEQSESERKRNEEALRRTEENFRRSLDDSPLGIRIVTIDGETIYANRAILDIYSYEDLNTTPVKKRYTPESYAEYKIRRRKRKRGDYVPSEYEISIIRKDGEVRNLQVYRKEILWDGERQFQVTYQDITERKRAEKALLESEARYRSILENILDVYYRSDKHGNLIMLSPSGEALLGYDSVDELIGKSISDTLYFNPEDGKYFVSVIRKKGSVGDFELTLKRKDGTPIPVSTSSRYYYDERGDILGIEGIIRDITERKRVEETLRESEEKYRYLVKYAPTGIYEVDLTARRFLSVNDAMCQYTGYTREEFLSMDSVQFLTEESQEFLIQRHAKVLAGEPVPDSIELQIKRKDGSEFWGILNSRYFDGPNDRILSEGIVHDITERKLAEEALQKSEERYRTILASIEEGYHEVDLAGSFTFFNDSFQRIMGYSREELMGMNYKQYAADEENARRIFQSYNRVYRTGEPLARFEWDIIRKEGVRRSLEVSASLIKDSSGNPLGFRGIVTDITDRKHAEEERRALQERLQRAEKMEALGTLAGGVAHDLNNVLGVVIGYAELLLMDADKSRLIRPGLVNIMNGAQRAAAIVQDLLTLARRGVTGREALNVNMIITDCLKSPEFEKLFSYHPFVRIKADLEPDLLNISGSSVHLGKTLFNLVSNASEAMPKGGVVTIKTANQYLEKPIQGYDEVREGGYVVLSVSDMGEGIPAADLKRIFEPFYTKKAMGRSGTGLGLAVVWGTVKDHNGYINVQSEEGKGSIFTLYFPVTREDISAKAVATAISEYMGSGESVLVVDDVKEQRDLAAEMLRKLNYNVTSVSSGEEAVAYLKEQTIDLMVLDMIMDPGMDGLDTYRSVIEIHPKQRAIIVSGFSESDRVKAAQSLGAGTYVRKPYVIEKLGIAVRKELDRK